MYINMLLEFPPNMGFIFEESLLTLTCISLLFVLHGANHSDASGGLRFFASWLVPLYFHVVGSDIVRCLALLS
jgi:hypothetical protein